MRTIAVQNLKGGTGKTTCVINISAALAEQGYKVLVLDVDAQGSIAASLGLKAPNYTMYDLLIDDILIEKCIVKARPNIDCIVSDRTLAAAETLLVNLPRREETLKLRMKKVDSYDFIFVDCPPSLSQLHQNALLYANELLVPISMDFLALLGAKQILESIELIDKYFEKKLIISGVIPTFFDSRTNISHEILIAIQDIYGKHGNVLPPVRIDTKIQQASAKRKTIFEYAPKSRAAGDFMEITKALLKVGHEKEN